jgi:hypothetical protein
MDEAAIQKAFDEAGVKNEIPCAKAFEISEKYGISKTDIAKYCNKHKVKFRKCQLGCF